MNDSEKVPSVSSSLSYDVRADEHNGVDSVETIRMTQAVEADLVAANASEYQLPGMAS